MANELDILMHNVTDFLSLALDEVQSVQETVDYVFGLAGSIAEDILAHYGTVNAGMAATALLAANTSTGSAVTSLKARSTRAKAVYTTKVLSARKLQVTRRQMRKVARLTREPMMLLQQTRGKNNSADSDGGVLDDLESGAQAIIDAIWQNITNGTGVAPPIDELSDLLRTAVEGEVTELMSELLAVLDGFVKQIKPALVQIGAWVLSFSDSMQSALEQFSNTLDKVQKIFDQFMSSVSPSVGTGLEQMVYDTYNLFDTKNVGFITQTDIIEIADLYGITALTPDKVADLFAEYDENNDGKLTIDEYEMLVLPKNFWCQDDFIQLCLYSIAKCAHIISGI